MNFFFIYIFCYRKYTPGDAFVGYHGDTAASVVLQVASNINQSEECKESRDERYFEEKVG